MDAAVINPAVAPLYQKHCPGCYADKGGHAVCPVCGYDESAPRSPLFLPHGVVLGGQYRVGRVLGKPGGFGITYIGWDVFLQQRVAIKEFLPRDLATRIHGTLEVRPHTEADRPQFDQGRERFLREARIVARFMHPNIVRVRSFFNANGTAYLVMDYYEGISLGEYLETVRDRLSPRVAVDLMLPVLRGLQYVHARGVIHRDVKPANIYLAADGRPILLDFGAATPASDARADSRLVMLTEGYSPLEQYQRRSPIGPYTDVYAAAATLYRMLTGEPPPMALDRLGHDPLAGNGYPAVPLLLRDCLSRALALRPEDRYADAAAFLAALEGLTLEEEDALQKVSLFKARHQLPDQRLLRCQETQPGQETRVVEAETRLAEALELAPEPGADAAWTTAAAETPASAAPPPEAGRASQKRWALTLGTLSLVEFLVILLLLR